MLTNLEIGEKISIARKLKNFSQAELAKLLAISSQAIGKWERGESMPDIIMFGRLAEVLGVDLNYFGNKNSQVGLLTVETKEKENQKPGWNMSGGNWIDADFSELKNLAEKFNGANIVRCKFVGSDLSGLIMKGNNIERSDFTNSQMSNCKFSGVNLEKAIFDSCDLTKSEFLRSNIQNCDFSQVNLTGVTFKWNNIKKMNLAGATLFETTFKLGQLTEIIFEGKITNCAFENCDMARVEFRNAIICNTFFKNSKLKRAKFIKCKVDKITYAFMKSCKADLTDVEIIE